MFFKQMFGIPVYHAWLHAALLEMARGCLLVYIPEKKQSNVCDLVSDTAPVVVCHIHIIRV